MGYDFNSMNQQLQDLQRQYQQLQGYQPPIPQTTQVPQVTQIPIPTPSRQVQYVEGLSGAKIYQQNLPPNSSEIIMDKEDNIFYMVSKDANGTPARKIPIGRFTLEESAEEEPAFLTRKDFDEFKEEMRALFMETKKPTTTASTSSKGGNK